MEKDKYKFWAKVSDDKNNIVKDVVCEIITPLKNIDKIEVTLKPISKEQYEKITSFSKCRIHGFVQHRDGTIQNEIKIIDSYIINSLYTDWGVRLGEYSINIHPFSLEIVTPINNRDNEKTFIDFWIPPNRLLMPFKMRTPSYTGSVDMQTGRQIEIILPNQVNLRFDKNYKYDSKENVQISISEVVARCEIQNHNYNFNETLGHVDDLLLLTSFAERRRIVCIGWDILDRKSHKDFYRRNVSMKTIENYEADYNDNVMIEEFNFEEYLKHTFNTYIKFKNKDLLKHAIQIISHKNTHVIEENFLRTFSVIETLVSFVFTEKKLSNTVLSKNDWVLIKKDLKAAVKQSHVFDESIESKEKRGYIYGKFEELNRLSFAECIKIFFNYYPVEIGDLWTLIGGDIISLKTIRDQLVHGIKMDDEKYSSFWCAENHLRWIAERMILAILDWDLEKTDISYNGMGHIYPYRDLKIHQNNLNDWKM